MKDLFKTMENQQQIDKAKLMEIDSYLNTTFMQSVIAQKKHEPNVSILYTRFMNVVIPNDKVVIEDDVLKINSVYFNVAPYVHILFSHKDNFYLVIYTGIKLDDKKNMIFKIESTFDEKEEQ